MPLMDYPQRNSIRFMRVVACIAFLLTVLACASTKNAATLEDGYLIRVWQAEDGLPQNSITAVTQTHDGYV